MKALKRYRRSSEIEAKKTVEDLKKTGKWADYYNVYSQDGQNRILYCVIREQ